MDASKEPPLFHNPTWMEFTNGLSIKTQAKQPSAVAFTGAVVWKVQPAVVPIPKLLIVSE